MPKYSKPNGAVDKEGAQFQATLCGFKSRAATYIFFS